MKNKKVLCLVIFILSLIFLGVSYNNIRVYFLVENGNKKHYEKKYEEADEYYERALKIREDYNIRINKIINLYEAEKYKEVLESKFDNDFINGNSTVKLLEKEPEKQKEKLEEALEYYKNAILKDGDINIKKNYEIILKKLEENKKQQEQQEKNQNKQQNQQNKEQNKNENKQNQEQQDQKNKQNQDKQDQENKQNQGKGKKENGEKKEDRKMEEVKAVLKRLEGNEEKAFKNNEKLEDMSNGDDTNKNRW